MERRSPPEAKNWCFTLYADAANTLEQKEALFTANQQHLKYWIFGREVAPTTGRKHLQCFVHLFVKKKLTAMKKLFPGSDHFEVANGTPEQNRIYCSKV